MKHLSKALLLLPFLASGQAYASCSEISGEFDCAGNATGDTPGGTMAVTVANDFAVAMAVEANLDDAQASGPAANRAGVGLECSWFDDKLNDETQVCTLPLSYTIHNEIDPRRQLTLKMPISRVESNKSFTPNTAYHVGLGASYTYPLAARWYVTPSANYTYAEAVEIPGFFGAKPKADLVSASIASAYFSRRDGFDIGVGNMFLYAHSVNEQDGQGEVHYNAWRNGLMFGWSGKAFGKKAFWEATLVDTMFFGSTTFTDHQIEVGLTVGDKRSYKVSNGGYRLGLSLFDGGQYTGAKLSWGYWF